MPLQNRVAPTGEIVAHPARGLFLGNRGILHDSHQRMGRARWRHPHWIVCRLDYKDRRRSVMMPGRWTALFFLDEATAFAAGHLPCAYCRREAFLAFEAAWSESFGQPARAPAIDRLLHRQRVDRGRRQVVHRATLDELPDGTFVRLEGLPHLVLGPTLRPWSFAGYGSAVPRPAGLIEVLTPEATVATLRHGYRPVIHPSAG